MAEYKLVNSILLKNYSKQVLPLADDKKPVTVTFDLVFRRLVDVVSGLHVQFVQELRA